MTPNVTAIRGHTVCTCITLYMVCFYARLHTLGEVLYNFHYIAGVPNRVATFSLSQSGMGV